MLTCFAEADISLPLLCAKAAYLGYLTPSIKFGFEDGCLMYHLQFLEIVSFRNEGFSIESMLSPLLFFCADFQRMENLEKRGRDYLN